MKAVVATFNQEKALVGAFSVITNLRMQFGWNFLKVGIVVLDNVLFPEEKVITFVPLDQRVKSTIRYTGNGFIPCLGMVPTPDDCHFPQYKARMQRRFNTDRE